MNLYVLTARRIDGRREFSAEAWCCSHLLELYTPSRLEAILLIGVDADKARMKGEMSLDSWRTCVGSSWSEILDAHHRHGER